MLLHQALTTLRMRYNSNSNHSSSSHSRNNGRLTSRSSSSNNKTSGRSGRRTLIPIVASVLATVLLFVAGFSLLEDKHQQEEQSEITKLLRSRNGTGTATTIDDADVTYLNERFGSSVDDILEWVCTITLNQRRKNEKPIVQLTSFGASSMVILHKLNQRGDKCLDRIPIVLIDTLHLFPETYRFVQDIQNNNPPISVNGTLQPLVSKSQLHIYKPKDYKNPQEFDLKFGSDLYKTNPAKYAVLTKIEPTRHALDDLHAKAWITGRRRSQGGERATLQAFERDPQDHRLKINPLVDWSYQDVWDYIRSHNVPYNPLYDQGYKSIGDVQTTAKVAPDADERSGRFQGLNQTECGMHEHLNMTDLSEQDLKEIERAAKPNKDDSDYIEITPQIFNATVLDETTASPNLFIVFFSPACSHCRAFEPTFMEVAHEFTHDTVWSLKPIRAGRYNVYNHPVPAYAKEAGLRAPGVPAIFLVQHQPFRVTKYVGDRDKDSILKWIQENGV